MDSASLRSNGEAQTLIGKPTELRGSVRKRRWGAMGWLEAEWSQRDEWREAGRPRRGQADVERVRAQAESGDGRVIFSGKGAGLYSAPESPSAPAGVSHPSLNRYRSRRGRGVAVYPFLQQKVASPQIRG